MRKFLPLLLVFALALAACGGDDDDDDDDVGSIEDAETCEDIGDVFIDELQVLLDELSDLDVSAITDEDQPEAMTNFEENLNGIDEKAQELGCEDEEMAGIIEGRFDELEADGPLAEIVLDALRSEIESGEVFE